MFVYLRSGHLIKRFIDVELIDCVEPQVDGVSVPGTEPTGWFKVLILDSLLVDCDGREVYWNKEAVVEATNIHWTKDEHLEVDDVLSFYVTQGKMFEGGCHDFVSDVDELFETGRSIVHELQHSVDEGLGDAETIQIKQKLFRLLHMFILPKLTLRKSELKDLQSALIAIEQKQKDTGINIATKEKIRYRTGRFLEKQRVAMLTSQDFSSERFVSGFNYQFLEHFLKHIETDIAAGNESMNEFENKIAPLRTCQTLHEQEMLNYWRDQRDKTWSHINKAVLARETVKNIIVRPGRDKDNLVSQEADVHPDHIVYIETSLRLQNIEDKIKFLRETLAKLTAIRGAVLKVISDILEHGRSCGEYNGESTLGRKAETDEWTSLSRKVDNLMTAKPLGFKDKHRKFCAKIIGDIKKLTDASKPRMSCVLEYQSKPRENDTRKSVGSLRLKSGFSDHNGNAIIEDICSEVLKHIQEMTEILATEIYQIPTCEIPAGTIESVYICYESYVSSDVMPVLFKVFQDSYKQQCDALIRCFSRLALSDSLLTTIEPGTSESGCVIARLSDNSNIGYENTESQTVLEMLAAFVKCETEEKMSVLSNMRNILEILQYIEKQAKHIGRKSNQMCTDDILDVLIILLQKLDQETFLKLYTHIQLLTNLKPYFVEGSRLQFALVSFRAAFQHLFNQNEAALRQLPK